MDTALEERVEVADDQIAVIFDMEEAPELGQFTGWLDEFDKLATRSGLLRPNLALALTDVRAGSYVLTFSVRRRLRRDGPAPEEENRHSYGRSQAYAAWAGVALGVATLLVAALKEPDSPIAQQTINISQNIHVMKVTVVTQNGAVSVPFAEAPQPSAPSLEARREMRQFGHALVEGRLMRASGFLTRGGRFFVTSAGNQWHVKDCLIDLEEYEARSVMIRPVSKLDAVIVGFAN